MVSDEAFTLTTGAIEEETKIGENTERANTQLYSVKLKVISDKRKVRKFFLRTPKERQAFINAILKAQGFNSQLEQYTIKQEIERT